jgi:hypothetical protein
MAAEPGMNSFHNRKILCQFGDFEIYTTQSRDRNYVRGVYYNGVYGAYCKSDGTHFALPVADSKWGSFDNVLRLMVDWATTLPTDVDIENLGRVMAREMWDEDDMKTAEVEHSPNDPAYVEYWRTHVAHHYCNRR